MRLWDSAVCCLIFVKPEPLEVEDEKIQLPVKRTILYLALFIFATTSGGIIFADSTLIERKVNRSDVKAFYVPATRLAGENGIPTLANMILMGKILKVLGQFDEESLKATMAKVIPPKHASMLDVNLKALKLGADYEE